jgi:catechol 2,3-dioxygenase-like lactoylglutathione lyase family enzyme
VGTAVRLAAGGADIGITARDPHALVAFYGGFLGLPLAKHLVHPDAGAQVWFFSIGDGHLKVLGFDRPPRAANPPGTNLDATGFRYIALRVESLDPILEGLVAAGGSVQRPLEVHGSSRVVFVGDPEGNCIELVEAVGA